MFGFGSRASKDRQTTSERRGGRRWAGARDRRAHVPRLEGLEVRITPVTATATTLSLAKNVTVVGEITTVTAQVAPVSPGALKPTGTVTFLVDGNVFRTV